MNLKEYLESRKTKLTGKLTTLKGQVKTAERDALGDLESQIDGITAELEDVNSSIAQLSDENKAELNDNATDLEDEATKLVDETTTDKLPEDEPAATTEGDEAERSADGELTDEQRCAVLKNIESRGGKMKKGKVEVRSGFIQFVAGKINEQQARSLGVSFNNGSVLVPEELSHEIISYVQEENPMRKYATIHNTKGTQGFPVQVKKAEANIVTTERDENNLIPFTDVEFDDVYLNPIEIDALIKVTKKLTLMSDFDVEAIVIEELKKAYLRKETYRHISDTTNPGSLVNKAVAFSAKSGDETDPYNQLVGLKNEIKTSMRGKARFMINRAAQTWLETIKNDSNEPILKEVANADFDYKIFTYPVEVTDYVDQWTGTAYDPTQPQVYFGDFSYFHIQDVIKTLEVEPLRELFSRENKVGFKIYHLSDGQLVYGPLETPVYKMTINQPAPATE